MIKFFLERKILGNLITIFLVIVGFYSFWTIRREAFPEISYDIVVVRTVYPGASPQEIDELITQPIEDAIRSVNGLDTVESYSLINTSLIVVRLDENLSKREADKVINELGRTVERVRHLPKDAEKPIVEELTSDRPLMTLSVVGGSPADRDHFADELKDALEDIPGVSEVNAQGKEDREIWVEASPERLSSFRLTLNQIASKIREQTLELPGSLVRLGKEELILRAPPSPKNAGAIGGLILRSSDDKTYLRIRDVAQVRETFSEGKILSKTNGKPSINLMIRKQRWADSIKLAERIAEFKENFEPQSKSRGISLVITDDISFFIKRRLKVMTSNLIQGGILILIALFVFLDWRIALVAAWGVPISFAASLAFSVPLGMTLNLLSLLAFILVFGMLDDDSVVAAENIYRHLEMGKSPLKAALEGTREIVLPVAGSIAVSSAAFLPFALVTGIMGKFLIMIPIIVLLCFAASVFEAFFILPSHVIELLRFGKPIEKTSDHRWYGRVVVFYKKLLGKVLKYRYRFVVGFACFLVATLTLAYLRLRVVMFPGGIIEQFFIRAEFKEGTSLEETERQFDKIENLVKSLPQEELETFTSTIGLSGFEETLSEASHLAQARVFLTQEHMRKRTADQIINDLRQRAPMLEGLTKLEFETLRPGPPAGKAVLVRVRGKDEGMLKTIAQRIKSSLAQIPGVTDIKDSAQGGKEEIHVSLNAEKAAFAKLLSSEIAQNISLAYGDIEAARVRRQNEEVKIKVRLDLKSRKNLSSLGELRIANVQGADVALKPVIEIKRQAGFSYIERYNFKRTLSVTASVDNKRVTSREANALIAKKFKDIEKEFPGYGLVFGGEERFVQRSFNSLYRGFGIALILNFVILATLFRSYSQPLIILFIVPIGLVGVSYALMLHGRPLSFMALLGVVAMSGVVLNNAIVLVDFINREHGAGKRIEEAVMSAGAVRLRPIWASSLTTLVGLFPMAYGFGGSEPFVQPMALALAWGLMFAMPMTLFVIPVGYVILDDLRGWIKGRASSGRA